MSRLSKGLIYGNLSPFIRYSTSFRGLGELVLDAVSLEDASRVSFRADGSEEKNFAFYQPWIDTVLQTTLFVANGSRPDLSDEAFVIAGWESLHIISKPKKETSYRCYTQLSERTQDPSLSVAAYLVASGGRLVAICDGITLRPETRGSLMARVRLQGSKSTEETLPPGEETIAGQRQSPPSTSSLDETSSGTGDSALTRYSSLTSLSSNPTGAKSSYPEKTKRVYDNTSLCTSQSLAKSDQVHGSIESGPFEAQAIFHTIVAEEMGVSRDLIQPTSKLVDLGMDSILASSTLKALQKKGMDLKRDFFMTHQTYGEMVAEIQNQGPHCAS